MEAKAVEFHFNLEHIGIFQNAAATNIRIQNGITGNNHTDRS